MYDVLFMKVIYTINHLDCYQHLEFRRMRIMIMTLLIEILNQGRFASLHFKDNIFSVLLVFDEAVVVKFNYPRHLTSFQYCNQSKHLCSALIQAYFQCQFSLVSRVHSSNNNSFRTCAQQFQMGIVPFLKEAPKSPFYLIWFQSKHIILFAVAINENINLFLDNFLRRIRV